MVYFSVTKLSMNSCTGSVGAIAKLNYTANYWIDGMNNNGVYVGDYEPVGLADLGSSEFRGELVDTYSVLGLLYDSGFLFEAIRQINHDKVVAQQVIDCINKKLNYSCPIIIT